MIVCVTHNFHGPQCNGLSNLDYLLLFSLRFPYFFVLLGKVLASYERLCDNCDNEVVSDGETISSCLFLGILEHVDILRDICGLGVVEPHFDLEVDNIEHVEEASAVLLEVVKEYFGLDINAEGCSMSELASRCPPRRL